MSNLESRLDALRAPPAGSPPPPFLAQVKRRRIARRARFAAAASLPFVAFLAILIARPTPAPTIPQRTLALDTPVPAHSHRVPTILSRDLPLTGPDSSTAPGDPSPSLALAYQPEALERWLRQ
jgi:hypothetical protein